MAEDTDIEENKDLEDIIETTDENEEFENKDNKELEDIEGIDKDDYVPGCIISVENKLYKLTKDNKWKIITINKSIEKVENLPEEPSEDKIYITDKSAYIGSKELSFKEYYKKIIKNVNFGDDSSDDDKSATIQCDENIELDAIINVYAIISENNTKKFLQCSIEELTVEEPEEPEEGATEETVAETEKEILKSFKVKIIDETQKISGENIVVIEYKIGE